MHPASSPTRASVTSSSTDGNPSNNTVSGVTSSITPADTNPCQTGPGNDLWAFGENTYGSLGTGGASVVSTPSPVNLLRDVRQLSASGGISLAVLGDRSVCSWGGTWPPGTLGRPDGPTVAGFDVAARPTPRPVLDNSGQPFRADRVLAAPGAGFAIVDPDGDGVGTLYGWGTNTYGAITPGSPGGTRSRPTAVPLPGGRQVRDVSSNGGSVAAITDDRRVFTWGWDSGGELGPMTGNQTGLTANDLTPYLPLAVGELPERVFLISSRTLVLTNQGRGLCFAPKPAHLDASCNETIPVAFDVDLPIISADAGGGVAMVLDDDGDGAGEVRVWGANPGDGTAGDFDGLAVAAVPEPVVDVEVGSSHVVALGESGQVWAWGNPRNGVLDSGGFASEVVFPVPLGMTDASFIEAGSSSTFVRGTPTSEATRYESIEAELARGATGGTDVEANGATAEDRLETTITNTSAIPNTGRLGTYITEGPLDPAIAPNINGFRAFGEMVSIVGRWGGDHAAPAADPYVVRFNLYLTPAQRTAQTAFGGFVERIAVLRNNAVIANCPSPTPPHGLNSCVRSRAYDPSTGNAVITIATTVFSRWTFAAPAPVVDAGGPYTVAEGSSVALAGSVSGVPVSSATIEWSTSVGRFDNPAALGARFSAEDEGLVTIALTATAAEQSRRDLANVTVRNANPVIGTIAVSPAGPVRRRASRCRSPIQACSTRIRSRSRGVTGRRRPSSAAQRLVAARSLPRTCTARLGPTTRWSP